MWSRKTTRNPQASLHTLALTVAPETSPIRRRRTVRPTNKPGGVSDRHMLPVPWALRNPSNPRHTFPLGSRMPFELPGQHGTPAPMIGPMIGYHWTSRLAHAVREQRDDEGLSGYHVSTRASPAFRLSLTSPPRVVHTPSTPRGSRAVCASAAAILTSSISVRNPLTRQRSLRRDATGDMGSARGGVGAHVRAVRQAARQQAHASVELERLLTRCDRKRLRDTRRFRRTHVPRSERIQPRATHQGSAVLLTHDTVAAGRVCPGTAIWRGAMCPVGGPTRLQADQSAGVRGQVRSAPLSSPVPSSTRAHPHQLQARAPPRSERGCKTRLSDTHGVRAVLGHTGQAPRDSHVPGRLSISTDR